MKSVSVARTARIRQGPTHAGHASRPAASRPSTSRKSLPTVSMGAAGAAGDVAAEHGAQAGPDQPGVGIRQTRPPRAFAARLWGRHGNLSAVNEW